MSKVSDALRRASEDSGQSITRTIDEREQRSGEGSNGGIVVNSPLISQSAHDHEHGAGTINGVSSYSNAAPRPAMGLDTQMFLKPKAGLRKKIGNLFFGWDLANCEDYPLVALEKNSPAGEQFKIFRGQINKICNDGGWRSILVTSPVKGDGKTTVAANLAAAMALDYEQQVLLIDADLRCPSVHRYFGLNDSPGLAEYLGSNSGPDLLSYVQSTALPGLRVLPAGSPTALSSELLATERMKSLIREIPELFPGHQIIVDTSPVLSTSDPLVLSRIVDGLVMVVRAGKTPRDCLSAAFRSLGSNKVMGIVLNGTELGTSSKYYQYSPVA